MGEIERGGAAAKAVDYLCYQARLTGALGGLDRVVFTGGIGENSAGVRGRICAELGYLGIGLDSAANKTGMGVISKPDAGVTVEPRATDQEKMIACHVAAKLAAGPVPQPAQTEG